MTTTHAEPATTPRTPWLVLALLLVTALVYARSLSGEFVYDDRLTVERNPAVVDAGELVASLAKPMWDFTGPDNTAAVGYWRPLASISLWIGHALGGGKPWAFHALSIALHLAATWVAFRLARRLTGDVGVAFFAAAFFGLHPVHVEAVAWISAINEPLCGLFVLSALDAFVAWRDRESSGAHARAGSPWLAGLWMALAILSKELAVAVVPLALAIDVGRRVSRGSGPFVPNVVRAYAPFVVVVIAWYAARVGVFSGPLAGFDRTTTDFGVDTARRVSLRVQILGDGLRLIAWPHPQRVFHPFRPGITLSMLLPSLAAVAGWVGLVIVLWKRRAGTAAAIAAFAPLSIVPMLGRVEALGIFPLSERYLYVAVFGAGTAAAWIAWRTLPRAVAVVALSAVALVLGWRTHDRSKVWADDTTLLGTAAKEAPESAYAHRVLGRAQLEAYRVSNDPDMLRAAHESFQTALDLGVRAQRGDESVFAVSEDFVQANVGLGWSLMYEGEATDYGYDEAATVFKLTTNRYPASAEAWTGLGVARTLKGDLDGAQAALERALVVDSRFVEAHSALGQLWRRRGDFDKARASFETALRLRPDDVGYLVQLAGTHLARGDEAAARAAIERARGLAPRDPRPVFQLGALEARGGRLDAALARFDDALALSPTFADAWIEKGKVLAVKQESHGAARAFQMACQFAHKSFTAHYNAGILTLQTEGLAPAMSYLTRAYELRDRDATGDALRDALGKLPIQSPDTFLALAAVDADRGDPDAALGWLARAFEMRPDHGPALYLKGAMLKKKGDLAGALAAWKRAVEVMPESLQAQESTGMLLKDMGDRNGARAYLTQALKIAEAHVTSAPEMPTYVSSLKARLAELDTPP